MYVEKYKHPSGTPKRYIIIISNSLHIYKDIKLNDSPNQYCKHRILILDSNSQIAAVRFCILLVCLYFSLKKRLFPGNWPYPCVLCAAI